MARYVDGFVLSVSKKKLPEYIKMAKAANKFWIKYGALEVIEAVGDDLSPDTKGAPIMRFPKLAGTKPSEVTLFSFIIYKSRAHRDRVNKKVMADPKMHESCIPEQMPFDPKNMAWGGFKSVVHYQNKE